MSVMKDQVLVSFLSAVEKRSEKLLKNVIPLSRYHPALKNVIPLTEMSSRSRNNVLPASRTLKMFTATHLVLKHARR